MINLDVLENVQNGKRSFTKAERQQAIKDHNHLYEYVRTQNKEARNQLTDAELADEVWDALHDYAR